MFSLQLFFVQLSILGDGGGVDGNDDDDGVVVAIEILALLLMKTVCIPTKWTCLLVYHWTLC